MSDPGNHDAGQHPAAGQPPAGWYFAQGDPPGTERYWNGSSWEGTYRAVGGFSPSVATARPDAGEFPANANVLAWVVTVLKAIPLILLALVVALFSAVQDEIEAETDLNVDEVTSIIYIVGGLMIVIGLVLLVGQMRAILQKNLGQATVWAGIMTAIDVIYFGLSIPGGDAFSLGIALVILGLQGWLFWMLFTARKAAAGSGT